MPAKKSSVAASSSPAQDTVAARSTAAAAARSTKSTSVSDLEARQEYDKIPSAIPYTALYMPFVCSLLDFYGCLGPLTNFGCLFYFFVIIPIIDVYFGFGFSNPSSKIIFELERAMPFRIVTWLFVPLQLGFTYWALTVALPQLEATSLSGGATSDSILPDLFFVPKFWGLLINAGTTQAYAILTAHELIHKMHWIEHSLGNLLLVNANFPQYSNEHLLGHHRDVGLMCDPTCSDEGESYWAFAARNIPTYIINSFKLDFKKSCLLFGMTIFADVFLVPRRFIVFHLLAGLIGQLFLLVGDYIEHYGLRGFRQPGEPVTPMVSWSDSCPATTVNVLRVNVHAHHHEMGGLRYCSLRSHAYSPQLPPYGYAVCMLMALVPPVWFRVMNPRLEKARQVMKYLRESGEINRVFTREYLDQHSFAEDYKKIGWF